MEITEKTLIEDLVRELPESVRALSERGIVCIRCGEPYWGTLEELAAEKGITDLQPARRAPPSGQLLKAARRHVPATSKARKRGGRKGLPGVSRRRRPTSG